MGVFYFYIMIVVLFASVMANKRINISCVSNIKLLLSSVLGCFLAYSINSRLALFYYLLIPIFVFIAYMDFRDYLIINQFNYFMCVSGIVFTIYGASVKGVFYFLIFIGIMIIIKIIEKITNKDIIGDGDLKLFIALSFMFLEKSFFAIYLGAMMALICESLIFVITKNRRMIPFGPYLVLGYYIVMLFFI